MYEVGKLPHHDLDTPQKLVVGNTTTLSRNNHI